jgi:hypothetical protein
MDSVHEAGQHRHNSPANQDSGDPDPRSDLVQQQIAGDFKEEVAEKENPEDQSVLLAGDRQLPIHRERRKPDVDAIEKGNDKKQEDKNPYPYFLNRRRSYRDRGDCKAASHPEPLVDLETAFFSFWFQNGRDEHRGEQCTCIVNRLRPVSIYDAGSTARFFPRGKMGFARSRRKPHSNVLRSTFGFRLDGWPNF